MKISRAILQMTHVATAPLKVTLTICLVLYGLESALGQSTTLDSSSSQAAPDTTLPLQRPFREIGWVNPSKHGVELTGTLTRYAGDKSDDVPLRIWAYGQQRFRIETDSAKGVSSLVVRDGGAKRIEAQKTAYPVSRQTAAAIHQWMVPWLMFDQVLSSYAITDTTTALISGESATGYKLSPKSFSTKKARVLTKDVPYDTTLTIWVSTKGLPIRIDYLFPSNDNRYATTEYSRAFRRYENVAGTMIPMEEEQYIGEQKISRIVFDKVVPTENLDDTHFTLPASEKTR